MAETVYILGARKVSFTDDSTGNLIEGTSVHFVPTKKKAEDVGAIGVTPTKHFIRDTSVFASLAQNGSGFYEMVAHIDLFSAKPKLVIEGFIFKEKGNINFALDHARK